MTTSRELPTDVWKKLLSDKRLGRDRTSGIIDGDRDEFERDHDRIVFSSAFRRLKDKTQVFPLSKNDFTRTRLTHSIEVACIGRSLGRKVQRFLLRNDKITKDLPEFATIVASACLAHDIGNPPFGHSGEAAIQSWAKSNVGTDKSARFKVDTAQQEKVLHEFEGNAQAIRVLSRIQSRRRTGGMQLTYATLGAMMKYPCGSVINGRSRDIQRVEQKKFGYFEDESELILSALRDLGMKEYGPAAFCRHPLAFLVEAADDICYALVDLEDSVDQKVICEHEACALLEPLAKRTASFLDQGYTGRARLEWLRAYAINALVVECAEVFNAQIDGMLNGTVHKSLIELSDAKDEYELVTKAVKTKAYKDQRVLEVEAAGFQVIRGLLDCFAPALISNPDDPGASYGKLIWLLPDAYLQRSGEPPNPQIRANRESAIKDLSTYQRLLIATDYISGMTDTFAVDLYQKLSGIRLPT